jgi:outer membrane protein OmpA-like peptidoglycan-associated protein
MNNPTKTTFTRFFQLGNYQATRRFLALLPLFFLLACQGVKNEETTFESKQYAGRTSWKARVREGDKFAQKGEWKQAANAYCDALDSIEDPRQVANFNEIYRKATDAQLLWGKMCTITSRGGEKKTRGTMKKKNKGFEPVPIANHLSLPIHFDTAEPQPNQEGRETTRNLASHLKDRNSTGITLIGHTDERGSREYNQELSEQRAASIKDLLEQQGITIPIHTEGKGEEEPYQPTIQSNLTQEEIWKMDRRVECRVEGN